MHALLILLLTIASAMGAVPLDSTRSIDLRGKVGVWPSSGGIPHRATVWTNYPVGTLASDIAYDLNHNVPTNVVIQFTNSTYQLDSMEVGGISVPHGQFITLRGNGPGQTIIQGTNQVYQAGFFNFRSANRLDSAQTDTNMVRAWDAGYAQGSSNITIRTAGNTYGAPYDLEVGTVICLDQLNEANIGLNHLGYDGSFADASQQMFRGLGRGQQQYTEIQSISNGTNLVIWPPVMMTNIQSGLSPQIWWWGRSLEGIGIEDMTIDLTKSTNGSGACHDWAFFFQGAKNCWLKNVEIKGARKGLFGTWTVMNFQASHCFTHDPLFSGTVNGASQYGCNPTFGSFFLIENCAWRDIATPINVDAGSTFGAVAYSYFTNMVYLSGFFMGASIQSHYYGSMGWTFEGNYGSGLNLDFIHGSSGSYDTSYRNRWLGQDPASLGPDNANTFAVFVMGTNRYVNVVGDILGTTGYHLNQTWFVNGSDPSNTPKTVIRAGHYGNNQTSGQGDTPTVTTLWLDGNYDTVSASTTWDASDSNHTLPDNSRVYTGQPSWWTTYWTNTTPRWPLKGPDLSPMDAASPIQLEIDSGTFGGSTGGGTSGGGTGGGGTSNTSGAARSHGRVMVHGRNVGK